MPTITSSPQQSRHPRTVHYALCERPGSGGQHAADGAPGDNTTVTATVPVVTIGGQPATVQYHGLAPGYAGVYQVNVQVPTNISAGNQPITISIGGNTSPRKPAVDDRAASQ